MVLEAGRYQKRDRISAFLLWNLSTTRYDYTITLGLGYILLGTFLFLVPDFGSPSFCRSPLFRLSLQRLRFCFLDQSENFLRIKDILSLNRYALPFCTFLTDS
jgi:hypothetical protein